LERKLASIQKVADILSHENADKLEICKILGWNAVVLKGQFKKDELVVYVETDAVLPEGRPEWEFMRERHFRVKTIRLRGVVSQGLVFPLTILPPPVYGPEEVLGSSTGITTSIRQISGYFQGQDVTELLGITKYEPYVPAQLAGKVKGSFPGFLRKTDETRIQTVPDVLIRHAGKLFYITEKLDGTSATYFLNNGTFGVCSRNLELSEDDSNIYWKVAKSLNLQERLAKLGGNFAIQGELVGNGIQKNKYNLPDVKFFLFNIFDIDKQAYLNYDDFRQAAKVLELETVPVVSIMALRHTVEELVELSKGQSALNKNTQREGIIWRTMVEDTDVELGRLSFKIINPEFLLKFDE